MIDPIKNLIISKPIAAVTMHDVVTAARIPSYTVKHRYGSISGCIAECLSRNLADLQCVARMIQADHPLLSRVSATLQLTAQSQYPELADNYGSLKFPHIYGAAWALAQRGPVRFTRRELAQTAGVSAATVSNAFGSMQQMHQAIISMAISRNNHVVIANCIRGGVDLSQSNIPQTLKQSALRLI